MTKTFAPGTLTPKDLKEGDVIGGVWTVGEVFETGVCTDENTFSRNTITAILSKFEVTREVKTETKVIAIGTAVDCGVPLEEHCADKELLCEWEQCEGVKPGDVVTVTREVEL